jgi:hypothetical protein
MMISDLEAILTGERMLTKYTRGVARPSRDEIARLAYHLYDARGRQGGHDMEDWLLAEQQLLQHHWLAADYTAAE